MERKGSKKSYGMNEKRERSVCTDSTDEEVGQMNK